MNRQEKARGCRDSDVRLPVQDQAPGALHEGLSEGHQQGGRQNQAEGKEPGQISKRQLNQVCSLRVALVVKPCSVVAARRCYAVPIVASTIVGRMLGRGSVQEEPGGAGRVLT